MPFAYKRAAIALFSVTGTLAANVDYNLNVVNANVAPDGISRPAVTVNGVFPGTTIFGNKGDTFRLNVTDSLDNASMRRSTSIHWHGLFQTHTATEDGPAFVTQCPISPGFSYTYTIPTNDQAGTFWYHSHLSSQYVDGLKGALIIYDPDDPHKDLYDVDNENTVIQLSDWYQTPAPTLEAAYFATTNTNGQEPVPDSATINGKGRTLNPAVTTPPDRAVIPVTQGQRYRFRFINTSAIGSFRCSIEGHRMTVIEADGISHQPLTVDYFDIFAGQRYSVVVNATQPDANYWIRCPMTVRGTNSNLNAANNFAVLRYSTAPIAEPTTATGTASGTGLVEANLVPTVNPGSPGGASPSNLVSFNVAFTRGTDAAGSTAFKINGIQYKSPSIPTLLNILANGATTAGSFGTSEQTVIINKDDIIELVISGGANHPFHLHGHAFDVVKSSTGAVNYVNPPRRDVVASPATIRFRADNPGPWILHCHIDWHLEAGLAMVFAEAPSAQISGTDAVPHSAAWDSLCNTYNNLAPEFQ